MHEYSITRSLLDQALSETRRLGYKRISRIHLLLGESGGVVPECVQFYFDEMKKGTAAAGAELDFKRVPLRIRCPKCGAEWGPPRPEGKTAEHAKNAKRGHKETADNQVSASQGPRVPASLFEGMCNCNAGGDIISGQELAIESMDVD